MEQNLPAYEPPMMAEVGTFSELTRHAVIGSGLDNEHFTAWRNPPQEF
jgi:hypothetical protein